MWLLLRIILFATPLAGQVFDIPGDIDLLLFGDMKDYNNFFLLPFPEQRRLFYQENPGKVTLKDLKPIALPRQRGGRTGKRQRKFTHDVDDFNKAPSRRYMFWDSVPGSFKYFTYWHNSYYGKQDYVDKMIAKKDLEKVKKERLMNINLQFLIHARYKIGFALKTRNHLRDSSLYMMGYLMSKIRRFQYIQQNLVYLAHEQWRDSESRNFKLLLRTYEELMRVDVDIRDLITYVKVLDDEYESYCSMDPDSKCWYPTNATEKTTLTTPSTPEI